METLDSIKVLSSLTSIKNDSFETVVEEKLRSILNDVYTFLPNSIKEVIAKDRIEKSDELGIGWEFLHLILFSIESFCNNELSKDDALLSINNFRVVKSAIEIASIVGIRACLIPVLGIDRTHATSKVFKIDDNDITMMQKHRRLSSTANVLVTCFQELILRPSVLPQLGWLMTALLQLSHVPLKEPSADDSTISEFQNNEFKMTVDIYNQLKQEQEVFKEKLSCFLENCPKSMALKELIVIQGLKNCPKWLRFYVQNYLRNIVMHPNGVAALIIAICDEISDVGADWNKLTVTAKILATSHGQNMENYYNSVSSQILDILNSKNIRHSSTIAICCIKALYEYKPQICKEKILNVIMDPFLVKIETTSNSPNIIKTEKQVSDSIENISKCFTTTEAEFKCLSADLLIPIAVPLLYLHCKVYKSAYVYKNKVSELLLKILEIESEREKIFSAFLEHKVLENLYCGDKLSFKFGPNGGVEITSEPVKETYEEIMDSLYELIKNNGNVASDLFICLLKILPELNEAAKNAEKGKLLESTEDTIQRIEKQLNSVKLLSLLSAVTLVQERQVKNPEQILNFIKSLFSSLNEKTNSEKEDNQNVEILFMAITLIKLILMDRKIKQLNWRPFEEFIEFINEKINRKTLPDNIKQVIEDIEFIVKHKEDCNRRYCDESVDDNIKLNEFHRAMKDLGDPLLPVRAHAIISLTKLIEKRHPDAVSSSHFLLTVFQTSLRDDDSFLYLAAINGISTLSSTFPEEVLEILVHAFVDMRKRTETGDIAPETRAKLGEILVKTTRSLGEMTPKYKALLVNGFLSGVRDPDPLCRSSSLSCLGEFCKIMGFRLGNLIIEILYCIDCIIRTDRDLSCRRAAVMVVSLLLKGLGRDALTELGEDLVKIYRSLKDLRNNDKDPVLQLHAQLALEELDDIAKQFLISKPTIQKSIFLLSN